MLSSRFESLRAAVIRSKRVAVNAAEPDEESACYTRYSSENQDEKSIADQLRECREHAARNRRAIPDALHFSDEAVSGATVSRAALDALREKARLGLIRVLYVYSLSRLSRETTFALPLLKELNAIYKVRIISVSEGIDSQHPLWYDFAMMVTGQHERFLKELSANVRRGLAGTVISPYSCGDYVFGFVSIPSPDGAVRRKGGTSVPRRVYAIDQPNAKWVIMIFTWFAVERRSKRWIAEQLTRFGAPKDHRATTSQWTESNVASILKNEKYVGKWPWGETKRTRNPITGRVYQEKRPAEEISEDWLRDYPHLRLIDDVLFEKANSLLEEAARKSAQYRRADGTLAGSGGNRAAKHPLQNLIRCAKCGRPFVRAGANKAYLKCSGSLRLQCDVRTALRRDLATNLIREAVESRLLKNAGLLDAIFAQTLEQWRQSIARQPDALRLAEDEKSSLLRKIARIERLIASDGDGDLPPNVLALLREQNRALEKIELRILQLRSSPLASLPEPTRDWIEEQLRGRLLGDLLNGSPRDIEAFQGLFQKSIVAQDCEISGNKRKYFRARLSFCSEQLSGLLLGTTASGDGSPVQEVVEIEIRPLRKSETQARLVHSMWNDGASCDDIAKALKVSRSRVTAIFDYAEEELGLPKPDTRGRRPLSDIQLSIEKEVIARYQAGERLEEITKALSVSKPTVNRCLKRWHDQQGVPMMDGRARRKMLSEQRRSARRKAAAKARDAGRPHEVGPIQPPASAPESASVDVASSPSAASSGA